MIAILDYDAGNIRSVEKALRYLGQETVLTRDLHEIEKADRIVLPGVGAFGDAMGHLRHYGLDRAVREAAEAGKPFLGICLGLQLLFEESEESPGVPGLGILPGRIVRLKESPGCKIPHIGWNSLHFTQEGRLFEGLPEGVYAYFVHSYYLQARDEGILRATADYGVTIHASVECGQIFACQFHPEKSGEAGLRMLRNFAEV